MEEITEVLVGAVEEELEKSELDVALELVEHYKRIENVLTEELERYKTMVETLLAEISHYKEQEDIAEEFSEKVLEAYLKNK